MCSKVQGYYQTTEEIKMKLVAVNTDRHCRLYTKESGDYTVAIFDQSQKTSFDLQGHQGIFNGDFAALSPLNQAGINWAQYTIASR